MIQRIDKGLLRRSGKFSCCLVELVDDITVTGVVYEIRKRDLVLSECDDQQEALRELELMAALELQNRPTGSGM
jgi:hypothetical protein